LKLTDDNTFDSKEVKEAYRRLSKKWHPDKVDWSKLEGQEEKVQKRWMNLVSAKETLTIRTKYDNWRQYGHPDGVMSVKVVELMLPEFLLDKSMQPMMIALVMLIIVAIVLASIITLNKSDNTLDNGITTNTK